MAEPQSRERLQATKAARLLNDCLQAIAVPVQNEQDRLAKLMRVYAEYSYRTKGGGKCAVCRAHVRYVMTIRSQRMDGSIRDYYALCGRCLEAEKALARMVTMRLGRAEMTVRGGA